MRLTLPRSQWEQFMGPISLSQTSKPSSITLGDSHISSFPSLFKKKKRMKGEEKDFTIPKSVCFFNFCGRKEKTNTLAITLLMTQKSDQVC